MGLIDWDDVKDTWNDVKDTTDIGWKTIKDEKPGTIKSRDIKTLRKYERKALKEVGKDFREISSELLGFNVYYLLIGLGIILIIK